MIDTWALAVEVPLVVVDDARCDACGWRIAEEDIGSWDSAQVIEEGERTCPDCGGVLVIATHPK